MALETLYKKWWSSEWRRKPHAPAECPSFSLNLSRPHRFMISRQQGNVSTLCSHSLPVFQRPRRCCSTGLPSVSGSGHWWASFLEAVRMMQWHKSGLGSGQTGATGAAALAGATSNQAKSHHPSCWPGQWHQGTPRCGAAPERRAANWLCLICPWLLAGQA